MDEGNKVDEAYIFFRCKVSYVCIRLLGGLTT